MRIHSVNMKKFRGIDQVTVEFQDGFNLIKGENGKGKTSILEAIAVGLGDFVSGFGDVRTRHFSKDEIRKVLELTGDGSCDERYHVPITVTLNAALMDTNYEWTRGGISVNASRSTIQPRHIYKAAERLSFDPNAEYPALIYQGAGRVWSQKRERTENIFKEKYARSVSYMDTLLEASNIKLLLN